MYIYIYIYIYIFIFTVVDLEVHVRLLNCKGFQHQTPPNFVSEVAKNMFLIAKVLPKFREDWILQITISIHNIYSQTTRSHHLNCKARISL